MVKIISENFQQYLSDDDIHRLANGFCNYLDPIRQQTSSKPIGAYNKDYFTKECKILTDIRDKLVSQKDYILCLVLDENNRPIGYTVGSNKYNEKKNIWTIWTSYLEENYRGKQIATLMFRKFESLAKKRGGKIIRGYIHGNNPNPIGLCLKEGYRLQNMKLKTVPEIIALKRHDLCMEKPI